MQGKDPGVQVEPKIHDDEMEFFKASRLPCTKQVEESNADSRILKKREEKKPA